ncbi:uncharacterized protein LOC123305210 isoform X3 [Chrysoperla carnea]|uniref:uncharacterized protein LOC123305210 isoform X3 n=1 Tax=Chrysoperla carnea TaxID=189513 RepID=UPI001D087537|nr:uncharacterized protein LOC123305210 isoform X3 [Chrysoperla carnea]
MSTREVILDGGSPWGFRMHGGSDHNQPLRISRVNPGSKAALKGVREGDLISSINGRSTKSITNAEAHALLRNSGDSLKLGLNENYIGSPKRRNLKLGQDSADNSRRESLTSVDSLSQEKNSTSQNGYTSKHTSLDSENKAITEKLLNYNNNREHSSSTTTSEFNKFSTSDHCGAAVTSTTTTTSQLINSSRVSRLIDQQKTMADNTNTNNSIVNESDKQSDKKLTRNQRKRLNKKLNKQASTNSSSFDSTASTTPSSSSSTICEVLSTEQINSDTENNCNYRVDSPPTISTDSTKKATKKMAKSRSLDDDDNFSPGQIQITEITTEDESTDVNTALISDTEEDVEWETTTELRIPKNTLSTTGSFNAIAMNLDEPKKRCLTAEEEANFREFLKEFSKQYTEIPEFNDGKICYKSVENLLSPDSINERRARKRAMLESYFVPTYQNPRFLDIIHEEGSISDLSDKEASDQKLRKIQKSQLSLDDIPWIDDWGDYSEDDVFMDETQPKLVEAKFVTIDECQSSNWKMDRVQSPKDENIEVVFINDTDSETSHADDADDECSREDVLDGKSTTEPAQISKGAIPKTTKQNKSTKQEHTEINNNKQMSNKSTSETNLINNSSQRVQTSSQKIVDSSQRYNVSKEATSKLLTEERKSNEIKESPKIEIQKSKQKIQQQCKTDKKTQSKQSLTETTVKNSQSQKVVEQKVLKQEISGKETKSKLGMERSSERVEATKVPEPVKADKSIAKDQLSKEISKTKIESEIQKVNIQTSKTTPKQRVVEIQINKSLKRQDNNAESGLVEKISDHQMETESEKINLENNNIKSTTTEEKSKKIVLENEPIHKTQESKMETEEQKIKILADNSTASAKTISKDQFTKEVANAELKTEVDKLTTDKTSPIERIIDIKVEQPSSECKNEPKNSSRDINESKSKTTAKTKKMVSTPTKRIVEIQFEKSQEVTETEIKNNIETTTPIEKTIEIQIEKSGSLPKSQPTKRTHNTETEIESKIKKIESSNTQPIEKILKIEVAKTTTSREILPKTQFNSKTFESKIQKSEQSVETKVEKEASQSNNINPTERLIKVELENSAKDQTKCQTNSQTLNENVNIINVKFENSKQNKSKSKGKNENKNVDSKVQEHVIEISSDKFNQIKQDFVKQSSTETERIIEVKIDNTSEKQASKIEKKSEQMSLQSESKQKSDSLGKGTIEFEKSSQSNLQCVTDIKHAVEVEHGNSKKLSSQKSVETIIPIEREIDVKMEKTMKNNGTVQKPLICDTLSDSRNKGKNKKQTGKQNEPKSPPERKIDIKQENSSKKTESKSSAERKIDIKRESSTKLTAPNSPPERKVDVNFENSSKKTEPKSPVGIKIDIKFENSSKKNGKSNKNIENPLICETLSTSQSSSFVETKLDNFSSKTEISNFTVDTKSTNDVTSKNPNSKSQQPSPTKERIIEVKLENSSEESKTKPVPKSPPERKIDIKLENCTKKNEKSKKTLENPLICETLSADQSSSFLETKFENFTPKKEEISKSTEHKPIFSPSERIIEIASQKHSTEINQSGQTPKQTTENEINSLPKSPTARLINIQLENGNKKTDGFGQKFEKPLICDTLSRNETTNFVKSENYSSIKTEETKLIEETKLLCSDETRKPMPNQTEHIIEVKLENSPPKNIKVKLENAASGNPHKKNGEPIKVENFSRQESKEHIVEIKLENSECTNTTNIKTENLKQPKSPEPCQNERIIEIQLDSSKNDVPKPCTTKECNIPVTLQPTKIQKNSEEAFNMLEESHETIEVHETLHKKMIYPTKQFEDVKSTTTSTHRDKIEHQKSLENPSISGSEKVIEETNTTNTKFEDTTKSTVDLENFKFPFLTPPPTPENSDSNILDEINSVEFRNKIFIRKLLKLLSESSYTKQNIQQIYDLLQEVPVDQLPHEMQEIVKELLALKKETEILTDPTFEKEFESIFKTMKELTPQQNLSSPSRPESSNSIGSFGSSSTTTTAKYIPTSSSLTDIQSLIQQDETKIISNPKSLKEISLETIKSLPYGSDILQELANVSDIIETMAVTKVDDSFHITPNHNKSPILNDDDNTSSFIPEMTTPQQHKWLGLRSHVDPKLLVCLSPSQQNYAQHAKQISADRLLDMHQKFIERRGYHEQPNNNRLLSIIRNEDNSKPEVIPPAVPERTYRYTINPKYSTMPARVPPPIPEIDQERLSATNLPDWINLARNRCKSVTEYSTNVDFSKNNSNTLVSDGKLNYHTYKKTIKELKNIEEDETLEPPKRRFSLPQEIHEKQLKYILEKEREIEREIADLENEKQRLAKEPDPPQSLPEIRYLKRPTSMPTGCTVHGEFFRQQMYDEYLNKIAEREQRKQQKVIKLSSNNVHELLNEDKSSSNVLDFKQLVNIENEFMTKVKQRKQNLGIKESSPESDVNDSESDLELKNDLLKTISQSTKHIPKHLKEFVEFTTHEQDQQSTNVEQSSRSNGIWSPGQSQQTSETLLSESKKHSTSGPIPPPLPDPPKSGSSEPAEVVWTPKSAGTSPTVERKEFRPVNFESPTLPRKNLPKPEVSQNNSQNEQTIPPWEESESAVSTLSSTLERRLTSSQSAPLTGLNSLQQSSISSSPSTRLPRAQNPTITLLQKAREGQLPRGASYIEDTRKSPPRKGDDRPPLLSPGEIIYSVRHEYTSESDSEKPKKMVDLGPRKFEGIGPTTKDGMPIVLRSEVKENNQAKWYKRMYETLHKTKDGRYPYSSSGSGYLSEPEPNSAPYIYDSDSAYSASRYATLDRRRPQISRGKENYNNMSSTMPRNLNKQSMSITSTNNSTIKHGSGVYKNQPGRIENYVPGHSSISEKEAKEWWDEVMDIFDGGCLDKWLDDNSPLPNYSRMLNEAISRRHLEQQKLVPQHSKSYMSQALKESGYESDSTLIFKRRDETSQQLSPQEQKEVYKSIQRGGEVPLHGLRKTVPERPKEPELVPIPPPKGQHHFKDFGPESPRRYVENEVTIHYRSPVRQEIKEAIAEEELARRQAEAMRRIYQEERRRKYLQELHDMNSRRHTDNFTPSQKSPIQLNRYDDFDEISPKYVGIKAPRERTPDRTRLVAKALFNFVGQTPRELTFKKGDIIYVRRQIDKNWYEGEHNAMIGLFPFNYVEIIPNDGIKTMIKKPHEGQARAKFNFIAQTHLELSLAKGELVILTRRVDDNWFEGRVGNKKGIFPVSYVEVLQYPGEDSSKPVAAPAAHSLLLNGSSGGKQSMGSHHYTPQFPPSSPGAPQQQQHSIQSSVSYHHAKPVNVTPVGGQQPYGSLSRNVSNKPVNVNQTLHIDTHSEPIPYRAMYKYRPQNEDELELLEGDTVYVLEKCDDGWYVGSSQRTGAFGTFPGNYVERIQ